MSDTSLLPRPKSADDAQAEFLKAMGDPRTMSKYLAVIALLAIAACCALIILNARTQAQDKQRIVIRLDDLGRAQALGSASTIGYQIHSTEAKYFLSQFVHDYYGRIRATVREDYMRSLYFLNSPMASAEMESDRRTKAIEKFAVSGDDEIYIQVNNVVLGDLAKAPYTAQVDIDKIWRDRSGNETSRRRFVEGITFTITTDVPNATILVNPLGFTILSLREDESFSTKEK